jgi:hypothetical protein
VQSFYPEQPYNTKPLLEKAINEASSLNQIMNFVDSDTNISVNASFVSTNKNSTNKLYDSQQKIDMSSLKKPEHYNMQLDKIIEQESPKRGENFFET